MLTMSPYLEFANSLIDKYRGGHEAYTQISLIHPERESENPEPVQAQQNFITNLYRIQNIREENYLYTRNLTFLTELLVKKFQQNLYPSVEKQVEKMIREEFSDVRKDTVENFTKVIHKFVEKEGAEKLSILKENLLEKENNTEIKWQKEQEILFRKLENIYQSSIYRSWHTQNADQRKIEQKQMISNEQTLVFPTIREEADNKKERTQPVSQSEVLEQWTNILKRSLTMQSTEIFNQKIQKQVRQHFRTENVTNIRNEVHQESVLNYHVDGEEYPEVNHSETELQYLQEHVENEYVQNEHVENEHVQEAWNVQKLESIQKNVEHLMENHHQEVFPKQEITLRHEKTQNPEFHNPETELQYLQEHVENKHVENKHVENEHVENQYVQEVWNVQKLESMHKGAEHLTEDITNIRNEVHQESVLNYHVDGEEYHQHQEMFPRQEPTQSQELHHLETELKYLQEHAEDKHVKNEHAENQQVPEIWNVQKLESMQKDAEHPAENITNIRNEAHQESVLNYHVDGEEYHQHQEMFPRQEISSRQEQTQSQELHHPETELQYLQEHVENKHVESEHVENQHVQEVWNVQKLESMHKGAEHPAENITNIRNEAHQESVLNYHVDGEEYHQHQEVFPRQEISSRQEQTQSQELHHLETELKYLQEHAEDKHVKNEHAENQQVPEVWNVQKLESMHKGAEHPAENITNIRNEAHQESVLNYHVDGEEYPELHHSETELKYLQEHAEGKHVKNEHSENEHVKNENAENQQVPEIWNVQKLESMHKGAEHLKENITNIRNEVHQESVLNYHVDGEEYPELHHSETELKYLQEHAEGKRVKSEHAEGKHVKNENAENQQVSEIWNVQKLESMHKDAVHLTENVLNIRNEVHRESVLNYHLAGEEHHQHQELSGHTTYETGIVNKMINETYRNNPQKFQHMPASMVYSEESGKPGKTSDPEISKLQKQVDEVVKDLRTVEEKTVIRKKEITEKQQEIVREVLKNDSEVWSLGNGRDAIQREVHRILEDGMPESINRIAGKVYRRLEKELKMERGRRGMN